MIVTKLIADAEVIQFEEPFYTHHVLRLDEVGESASGVPYVMSFVPGFITAQLLGKISVSLESGDPGTAGSVPQVGDPHTWLATQTFSVGIEVESIADLASVARIDLSGDTILSDSGGIERLRLTTTGAMVSGNISVTGDMTIAGTTTRIDSTVVDIADRIIHLNNTTGANDPVPLLPTGVSIHRGAVASVDRDHAGMFWDETASRFKFALNTGGDDSTLGTFLNVQALGFFGSGASLTALDASNVSSGTLADARLSANIPLASASVSWTGSNHTFGSVTTITLTGKTPFGVLILNSVAAITSSTSLTFTSSTLTIGIATSAGTLSIRGPAGSERSIFFSTGATSARWQLHANTVAESGANVGSDLVLISYTDAGAPLATVISIARSTGVVTCNGGGITSLSATNISSGTLADARLSSNVPLKDTANTFSMNQTIQTSILFDDMGGPPTVAGELCRQGNYLHYHDGTSAMFIAVTGVQNTFVASQRFEQPIRIEDFEDLNNVPYASYDNGTFIFTFSQKVASTIEGDCALDMQCTTGGSNFTGICFTQDSVQKYELYYWGADNTMRLYGNDAAADLLTVDATGQFVFIPTTSAVIGLSVSMSGTGGTVVGVSATLSGAATENRAIYGNASGATTNWAGYFDGDINITGIISVSGTQVIAARETGWSAATGTATKGGFATATVTLADLAQNVKAVIDALLYHGLLGT